MASTRSRPILDVDRYKIGDKVNDTVIAVREVQVDRLPAGQRNWNNDHTVYTHGYGVVAANGNQRAADGTPVWSEKDLPPTGELGDYEPRIYFGEQSPDYSIVGGPKGGQAVELDTPERQERRRPDAEHVRRARAASRSARSCNRLLYATKFRDANILLSSRVNTDSKILYDRNPRERVEKAAPWLTGRRPVPGDRRRPGRLDRRRLHHLGELPVLREGRPRTTAPGTRTTGRGTIAQQPSEEINYIRNSVKAVVNAYDGSVELYAWDESDPILKTWMKAFPGHGQAAGRTSRRADVAPALPGGHVQGPARPAGEVPRDGRRRSSTADRRTGGCRRTRPHRGRRGAAAVLPDGAAARPG